MSRLDSWKNIPNTIASIPSWGTVELKYISSGDVERYASLLNDTTSSREFVASCVFNQILNPSVTFQNVINLPDSELEVLARALITRDAHTFSYFTEGGPFFEDFRQAIASHIEEITYQFLEMFRKSWSFEIESIFKNMPHFNWLTDDPLRNFSIPNLLNQIQIDIPQQSLLNMPIFNGIILEGYNDQFASVATSLIETQSLIDLVFQEVISASQDLLENINRFWKGFNIRGITEEKAYHILKEYNWLISPSLPRDMVYRVVRLSGESGRRSSAINTLFRDHFQEKNWKNLKDMVRSWKKSPISGGRYKILHDCMYSVIVLSGSKANPANVVLPTLMAQIDGLTSDYVSGLIGDNRLKRYDTGEYGRLTKYKNNRATITSPRLDGLTDDLITEVLFANTDHRPLPKLHALNRHQIMHGENTRYGRLDHMLRVFLVLDSLIHLIKLLPSSLSDDHIIQFHEGQK